MAKRKGGMLWVLVIVVAAFFLFGGMDLLKGETETVALDVELSVLETDDSFAIVQGPITKVDVTHVPFDLAITNGGTIAFTNVRLGPGTIPPALVDAFADQNIATLGPGETKNLVADVDVASLAPAVGSETFFFQAFVEADYMVGPDTFTKKGFSDALEITISPGAGIAVSITYT